ncbi:MAG: hypothetical protein NZ805_08645 [Armatimonadetes bacterium]|nr:hypothetical protein [Armatimonadota bacterium]MDW8028103.1 hypothetical protein [Armatimonadota bacterium]
MQELIKTKLQQIRLRKLECQRHMRVLTQKLASNPRDFWARKELERLQGLLAELEERERRLLDEEGAASTGGEKNVNP